METLDDLLIKRRRGTLSADDARRLRAQVRRSSELELALAAGLAFDREDTNAPGDAELIQHIASEAERRWSTTRRPSLWGPSFWGRAVVPLILAGAATTWATSQWLTNSPPNPPSIPATAAATATASAPPPATATPTAPAPAIPPPTAAAPSTEPAPTPATAPAPAIPTPPTPAASAHRSTPASASPAPPRSTPASASPAPPRSTPASAPLPPPTGTALGSSFTARELFERAGQARTHDWLKAESFYRALIDQYPNAPEAGIAEVALAKRALAEGRGEDALRWFVAHQARRGSSLRVEALWGEAEALELLGRYADAERALERLIRRDPDSSYAAAARRRLGR